MPEVRLPQLPLGCFSWNEIRANNFFFVDKTAKLAVLVSDLHKVFFARPYGMGKTLLCSMLKELFAHGTQDFAGTYIYDDWPEDQCYPVISLSFSEIYSDNFELALKHALVAAFENVGMAQARSVALTLELSAFLQCLDDIAQDQPLVFLIDDWDIAHSRGLLRTTTETKAELLLTKPWTHCERFTSGQPPRTLPLYF